MYLQLPYTATHLINKHIGRTCNRQFLARCRLETYCNTHRSRCPQEKIFADLQYMVVTDNTEIKPVIIAEINQGPAFAQPDTKGNDMLEHYSFVVTITFTDKT